MQCVLYFLICCCNLTLKAPSIEKKNHPLEDLAIVSHLEVTVGEYYLFLLNFITMISHLLNQTILSCFVLLGALTVNIGYKFLMCVCFVSVADNFIIT